MKNYRLTFKFGLEENRFYKIAASKRNKITFIKGK